MNNIELVNTVIQLLDQLSVSGARNMSIVLQSIQHLGALRNNLSEEEKHVQDKTN